MFYYLFIKFPPPKVEKIAMIVMKIQTFQHTVKGFTLLELLVVMSVSVLISTFVIVDLRSSNQNILLKNAGNELVVAGRQAQNLNLAGTIGPMGTVPEKGYSIKIFADNDILNPNTYAVFAEYTLGPQVVGSYQVFSAGITVAAPMMGESYYQVTFLPQNQGITLYNGTSATEMSVVLRNKNNTVKTVYVNALSGLIELR